jgi:DNA polymerase/3'-5' exonuclease PolX
LSSISKKIVNEINTFKNVGKFLKNVDYKNAGPKNIVTFNKMLTKNVGYTFKNAEEKMLTTLKKLLTKKCSQHFQKVLMKKY